MRHGKLQKLIVAVLLLVLSFPVQADLPEGLVTAYYTHTDLQGSVVVVTDQNRTVVETYHYEPYGLPTAPTASSVMTPDGTGYTGHVHDPDSGLVYMQQRYYDAVTGRFLSPDPVGVSTSTGANFNRYAYANNNPYRFIDPDGRNPCDKDEQCNSDASEKREEKRRGSSRNTSRGSGLVGATIQVADRSADGVNSSGSEATHSSGSNGGGAFMLGFGGSLAGNAGSLTVGGEASIAFAVSVDESGLDVGLVGSYGEPTDDLWFSENISVDVFFGAAGSDLAGLRGASENINLSVGIASITGMSTKQDYEFAGTIGIGTSPFAVGFSVTRSTTAVFSLREAITGTLCTASGNC